MLFRSVSLVERAQQQYDEAEAKRLEEKMRRNKFDFDDFIKQINQIKKMRPRSSKKLRNLERISAVVIDG